VGGPLLKKGGICQGISREVVKERAERKEKSILQRTREGVDKQHIKDHGVRE